MKGLGGDIICFEDLYISNTASFLGSHVTGLDQGFLVSPLVLTQSPGNEVGTGPTQFYNCMPREAPS
jgi:hypothetical protein